MARNYTISIVKETLYITAAVVIGAVVPLLLSPIVARLYSPEDFKNLGLLVAYTAILMPFVSLKLDNQILSVKDNVDKYLYNNLIIMTICAIVILFLVFSISLIIYIDEIFFFAVISSYLMSVMNMFLNAYTIKGKVKAVAHVRLFRPPFEVLLSITLGYFLISFGLSVSFVFSLFTVVALILAFDFSTRRNYRKININELISSLIENKKYPIYDLPTSLMIAFSNNFLLVFFSYFYNSYYIGILAFSLKYLMAPVGIVTNSIAVIFRKYAMIEVKNKGHASSIYLKTLCIMVVLSIVFYIILNKYAIDIFVFVFGETWQGAGEVSSIICMFIALKMISIPLSNIFFVRKNLEKNLLIQMLILFSSVLSLIFPILDYEFYDAITYYTMILSSCYILYIIMSWFESSKKEILIENFHR